MRSGLCMHCRHESLAAAGRKGGSVHARGHCRCRASSFEIVDPEPSPIGYRDIPRERATRAAALVKRAKSRSMIREAFRFSHHALVVVGAAKADVSWWTWRAPVEETWSR